MAIDFRAALKPVPAKPILDPVLAVRSVLSEYEPDIAAMVDEARALTIQDDISNAQASELGNRARKLVKGIEEIRKHHVAPLNERASQINAAAKVYTERLGEVVETLKRKITIFDNQLEIERRKAEEQARQAIAEEQARLDAMAKENGVAPVILEMPLPSEPPRVVRTESGSSFQKKRWTFEIENESDIPRHYLAIDEKKIQADINAGVREIPGVRIFQKKETNFR